MTMFLWLHLAFAEASFTVTPLQALPFPCLDPRVPTVLDEFILGCGPSGSVDRVMRKHDNKVFKLPVEKGWTTGVTLFRLGQVGGEWDPEEEKWQSSRLVALDATGATTSEQVVVQSKREVIVRALSGTVQYRTNASPLDGQIPVIVLEYAAWVEWNGLEQKVVIWDWQTNNMATVLANSPLSLTADGEWLGWSEDGAVVKYNVLSQERVVIQTGIVHGIAMHGGQLCWSEWHEQDIDVFCDDGFHLQRDGHQLWPQLHKTGLYFLESGSLMWLR